MEKSKEIGILVDKTWAFIPENGLNFLCLFSDESTRYLFLVKNMSSKKVDGENKDHFDGTLYKMPHGEILKKEKTRGLFNLLISERIEKPVFIPEYVMEARDVPEKYVSSLDEYIHCLQ